MEAEQLKTTERSASVSCSKCDRVLLIAYGCCAAFVTLSDAKDAASRMLRWSINPFVCTACRGLKEMTRGETARVKMLYWLERLAR